MMVSYLLCIIISFYYFDSWVLGIEVSLNKRSVLLLYITQTRAALRAEHGWIMDIYVMRRGDDR